MPKKKGKTRVYEPRLVSGHVMMLAIYSGCASTCST
jgi:hypothetical protein